MRTSRHFPLIAVVAALGGTQAACAEGELLEVIGGDVRARANGVIAVLGYTALPDSTTSSLSISDGSSDDPRLNQTQFGGAFTVSDAFPLYLEGFVGASRYDPKFVFSGGAEQRRLPTRWTGLAATGGVGWDIPIAENLALRPIVNVSLGHVESDSSLIGRLIERETDAEIDFLADGRLNIWGLGGSLMLDYELSRPDYEVDVELRYTHLHLEAFDSSEAVSGSSDAQTAALWSRLRVPTGITALDRPVRYVLEGAFSSFLGPNRGALGFDHLTKLGFGLELDSGGRDLIVSRTRLVARYVFGENVSGVSIGLGISF